MEHKMEIKEGLVILSLCQVQGPVQGLGVCRMHRWQPLLLCSTQALEIIVVILTIIIMVAIITIIFGDSSIITQLSTTIQFSTVQ